MILAQRILDCLRANGPIASAEFPKWFSDVERMDLDAEVNRLLRKSAISFSFNKYDLIEQKAVSWHAPFVSQAVSEAVPSAAEEVAASLRPPPVTRERFECLRCHKPLFDAEFRHSALGTRFKVCKYCDSKKMQAARLNSPEGECPQAPLPAHGTTSKPVVSEPQGNAGESLPTHSHTPPPLPPGSTEPPATSLEHPSELLAQGSETPSVGLEDPEALSPVGAAAVADSVLDRLAGKRAVLVMRRERLRAEYEAGQAAIDFEIERIDGVVGQVMKLLGEGN